MKYNGQRSNRMERNPRTREVVAYILATIAGTLLLPVVAPIIMWTNAREYTDERSCLPGVQSSGGVVSGLAAFVYVIVFAAAIGGTAFVASGGEDVFDTSPSATGDGLATVSTPEPTPTPTEEPTLPPVEDDTTTQDNETDES